MRKWRVLALSLALVAGCGGSTQKQKGETLEADDGKAATIEIVEYEKKTKELLETTQKLNDLQGTLDEQRRRLSIICLDYPDHEVCAPQTAATYARDAFCNDSEFTRHVDEIVRACHQGECKQVDQAELLTRSQYMTLTQRLPHVLITFRAANTKLDRKDRKSLQHFLENIQGEKGYVIVVGRASRDGPWRKNLEYALGRAEATRAYLVDELGMDETRVGFITYGHSKMYLTQLDAERLTDRRLSTKQANRSALIFSYPCYEGPPRAY